MSDIVMACLNVWLMVMIVAALAFIVSDFDRRRREEWFAAGMMTPAMAWSFALALLNLAEIISRLTGIPLSDLSFFIAGGI